MQYQLYAVRVFVKDWAVSVDYYENTLEMPCVFKDEKIGWAQFRVGSAYIGVERVESDSSEASDLTGRFVGVSLKVKNIEKTYQTLRNKGVCFSSAPERQAWGGYLAHFHDPDGNVLTLLGESGDESD